MKKRPKSHKIAQKPHQNHTKPPKIRQFMGFGCFSEFHNPLLAKLTDLAGINYQNNEKMPKIAQKPHKTAQKPPKNRQFIGLVAFQNFIIHDQPNQQIWWEGITEIMKNCPKPPKTAQKPPKNRHFSGLAVFQNFIHHNLPIQPYWWMKIIKINEIAKNDP